MEAIVIPAAGVVEPGLNLANGALMGSSVFVIPDYCPTDSRWLEHLPFAFWLVEHCRPSVIVDLGVRTGASFCGFAEAVKLNKLECRCWGILNPSSGHRQKQDALGFYHNSRYGSFSTLIDSGEATLPDGFADQTVDILHLNSDHSGEDVRLLYERWKPKLTPKAVVLFHSIGLRQGATAIRSLWQEAAAGGIHFEFHHGDGLGVLIAKDIPCEAIRMLTDPKLGHFGELRRFFSAMGDRISNKAFLEDPQHPAKFSRTPESDTDLARQLEDAMIRERVAEEKLEDLQKKLDDSLEEKKAATQELRETIKDVRREEFIILGQLVKSRRQIEDGRAASSLGMSLARRHQNDAEARRAIQRAGMPIVPTMETAPRKRNSPPRSPAYERVAKSGLFDESFYRSQIPDSTAVLDALEHYMSIGWLLGYKPNRLFDPLAYAAKYRIPAGVEPLYDYLTEGVIVGRRAHPLFDLEYYKSVSPDLAEYTYCLFHHFMNFGIREGRQPNPLFDVRYYVDRYADVALEDALDHYHKYGCWEGRSPHPLFDSAYYIRHYADVVDEMENPLLHYLQHGHLERFSPHPLFDSAYYVSANRVDTSTAGNLLLHYLSGGAGPLASTHLLFDASHYMDQRRDVAEAGLNPLIHFCRAGAADLTSPHLLFDSKYYMAGATESVIENPLLHYLENDGYNVPDPHPLFDRDFYLEKYDDVRRAGINPLIHFIKAAPREKRQPHPLFDTRFYLDNYRDVLGLEMNPLAHYLLIGANEGRMPNPYFETRAYRENAMADGGGGLNPLVHFALCDFENITNPGRHFDVEWYLETYPDVASLRMNPLVHFLKIGIHENRQPCGSSLVRANLEAKYPGITSPGAIAHWAHLKRRLRRPLIRKVGASGRIRLNMLFPDLDAGIVFGGYISALEFVSSFADQYEIRLVSTMQKLNGTSMSELRRKFSGNGRISRMLAHAILEDISDEASTIEVHPLDVFCAYSAWDGFLCHKLAASLGQDEFLYLCQEDEAVFHSNDSLHALIRAGQRLPSYQIFNTSILRDHFRRCRLGVFLEDEAAGMENSISFQHALVDTKPPSLAEMQSRRKIRVLIYARPEDHAKRNLFEIIILGINRFLEENPDAAGHLEFTGVGSMHYDGDVMITDTVPLRIMPKLSYTDYAKSLAAYDVGISLMYAPHPSILPFEMASAGLVVVTNQYEDRDAAVIHGISSNLIAVEPSPEGIVQGMLKALERVGDHPSRIEGAAFDWSRDWEQSFNPDFVAEVALRVQRIIDGQCLQAGETQLS